MTEFTEQDRNTPNEARKDAGVTHGDRSDSTATEAHNDGRDPVDRLLDPFRETAAQIEEAIERVIAKAGGVGTLLNAAVFNDFTMPAGVTERFRDTLIWLNQLAGDKSIGSGLGGRTGEKTTVAEKKAEQEERDNELREMLSDQIERQEWAQSQHSYAGMTMTGEEWSEFADELQGDTPLRKWLVEQIMAKDGKSETQAKQQADQIALLAKMQSVPRDQWTDEMKQLDAYLNDHPEVRQKYDDYLKRSHDKALAFERGAPAEAVETKTSNTVRSSTDAGAELFSSAPDLTEHHARAMVATEPLDVKADVPAAGVQFAATPASRPGSGFDV